MLDAHELSFRLRCAEQDLARIGSENIQLKKKIVELKILASRDQLLLDLADFIDECGSCDPGEPCARCRLQIYARVIGKERY